MPWSVDNKEPDLIQKEILSLGVRCEKLEIDLVDERSTDILFNTEQEHILCDRRWLDRIRKGSKNCWGRI